MDIDDEHDNIISLMSQLFSNFNLEESSGIKGIESNSVYN